jgi:hypothetical protein
MSKHDPTKQWLPDPPRNGSDPLSSTCTGSLSALVKGTEFFALLKVLRCTTAGAGVQRAASPGLATGAELLKS